MEEKPRSIFYHWIANIAFASLALAAGALFGERIPKERFPIAAAAVTAVALALVPVTRRWEMSGIEKRRLEKRLQTRETSDGDVLADDGDRIEDRN